MGNHCCQESRVNRQRLALLLVGLDNAGKTVAAKGLAGEPINYPIPTVGFSIIELKYLNYDVKIFDLGGGPNIRGIWHKYFVDVHGVIFVIDSCDSERFKEVERVLEEILSNEKITGKPLLILANKQDKEAAFDEVDIIECLNIERLVNKYKCPTLVQSCCASETDLHKVDAGIQQGYEWLVSYIDKNYQKLNVRVQMDVIEQEIKEREEMLAKLERIRAERIASSVPEDPDAIQTFSEYVSKINGNVKNVNDLQMEDFYSNPEEPAEKSSSSSSLTFPEVYYAFDPMKERERPKSAIQIVKHQLKLHDVRRSQSAKHSTRRNQTAPIKRPSAKEFMPTTVERRESVKSAVFTISNNRMGPGGDFYQAGVHRERFDIEEKFEVKKLPPLIKVKSRAEVNAEETNGICVVDVE